MTPHGVHGGKEPGMDTAFLDVAPAERLGQRIVRGDVVISAYHDRVEIE